MGLTCSDDHTLDEEEEDDQLVAKASELKADVDNMGKKHPMILHVKLPFWNNLSIPYASKDLVLYGSNLLEYKASNHLGFSYRSTSLASIPINLSSSEVFIESLRHCRRTRSAVEFASSVVGPGDVVVSPSPMCMLDSLERTFMAKSSLIFQLGTLDATTIRPFRTTSFSFSPMKNSELTGSPLGASSPLPLGPNFVVNSPSSQLSDLKGFESSLDPCSSTNTTSSYQSNSPHLNVSKGIIHCVWRNGSLSLIFKGDDDKGIVFTANVHKIEPSVDMAIDYLYIFRSMTGNNTSKHVGKMKVFSSVILNQDRSKSVEMEFVLFGAEKRLKEVQDSTPSAIKNMGLSKRVAKMFRSNNSVKRKDTGKIDEPGFRLENFLQDFDESELLDGLQPSLELASIVVKNSMNCVKNEAETGGWGLKFLKRADASRDSLLHETSRMKTSIDVLIPAGFHGGQIAGEGGPSTLTERWQSGGHCDCGGWDIGCPLTVLHNRDSSLSNAWSNDEEDYETLDLFKEGKNREPTLRLVTTGDRVFTVYFRPTLSALQAFSVGAAIIHSRTLELHPKL